MERWSLKKIARAAVPLLDKYPHDHVVQAIAQEVVAQRRGRDVDELLGEIAAELLRSRGHAAVTVATARPLSPALLGQVTAALKRRLKADTITVDAVVEPAHKGGLVAVTPIGTLRASVASRLTRLQQL